LLISADAMEVEDPLELKRKYSYDQIMDQTQAWCRDTISMAFIVMCSEKVLRLLRLFFVLILGWFIGSLQPPGGGTSEG